MTKRSYRESCAPLLVVLLILPALPLGAQESSAPAAPMQVGVADSYLQDGLSLGLEEAFASDGIDVGVEVADATPTATTAAPKITRQELAAVTHAYAPSQDTNDPAASAQPAAKKGGWWKRHWYIPAAAAVILGVLVLADDGEDKDEKGMGMN